MTTFYVVITYYTYVVANEITHVANLMTFPTVNEIEVISCWLTLKNVASVNKDGTARQTPHLLTDKAMDTLQTAFAPTVVTEIVRKIIAVDISGE